MQSVCIFWTLLLASNKSKAFGTTCYVATVSQRSRSNLQAQIRSRFIICASAVDVRAQVVANLSPSAKRKKQSPRKGQLFFCKGAIKNIFSPFCLGLNCRVLINPLLPYSKYHLQNFQGHNHTRSPRRNI